MKQKLRLWIRKIFLGIEGGLRPAWRAALGILLTLAAYSAVLYGLAALFGALFDAWGLTTSNLTRAPRWAQSVVRWHSDFCYALAYGAGIAVAALWSRRFSAKPRRKRNAACGNLAPSEWRTAGEASPSESSPAHANESSQPAKQRGESARTAERFASARSATRDSGSTMQTAERPASAAQPNESTPQIAERPASARSAARDKAAANETSCVPEARARRKPVLCAILLGLLLSGGLGALALATDCMRLESPWSGPHFALSQLSALLVLALGRLLSEMITKRLCFDVLRPRAAWLFSVALAALLNLRTLSVLGALNALLLAAAGCALYERGGLTASASLQIVWTAAATLLLGYPGMSASAVAVWPIYHVSDAWLTGGNAGPMSGAWFTLLLSAALLLLLRQPLTAVLRKLKSRAKRSRGRRDRRSQR